MIKLPLDDNDPRHGMGDRTVGSRDFNDRTDFKRPTTLSDLGDIDSHAGSGRVPMDEWPFGRPRTSLDPVVTRNVEDTARVGPEQAERRRILRDQLIVGMLPIVGNVLIPSSEHDVAEADVAIDEIKRAADAIAERVYPRRP